jgi:hypothetical protein
MAVIGARPASGPVVPRPAGTAPARGPAAHRPSRIVGGERGVRRVRAPLDVRPLLVAIAVAAALAFFYLSQSTRVAATGYEIEALRPGWPRRAPSSSS